MTAEHCEKARLDYMDTLGFGTNAMKQVKVCGTCGMISPAKESACVSCGTTLPTETMFDQYRKRHKSCDQCGIVVPSEAVFCPQCGTRLTSKGEE